MIECRAPELIINHECRLVLEAHLGGFWRMIAWLMKEKALATWIWHWEGLQMWAHERILGLHFRRATYDGACWCCEVQQMRECGDCECGCTCGEGCDECED